MLILLGKISTCCLKMGAFFECHPHRIRKEKRRQWISVRWMPAVMDTENLKFSVLHKGSEILFSPGSFDRFGLVNGKPFHKPPEFLARQEAGFRSIARPLEPAVSVKPLLEQYKTILVKMERLEFPAVPSAEEINCICIRIEFVNIAYDRHKSVKALAHICTSGDNEDLGYPGQIT